jgi:aminopeptidase N
LTQSISKKRGDYRVPPYLVSDIKLEISLDPEQTKVCSLLKCQPNPEASVKDQNIFVLDGVDLEFVSLSINGIRCEKYELTDIGLSIPATELPRKEGFELTIENRINPQNNASLEGLYLSNNAYCTQCEAEGFRKITFFPDRPDILSIYTVDIIVDAGKFPHILSNGNLVDSASLSNGLTRVSWHDPHPKPCYLFALVAGDFDKVTDNYTTQSGRQVALELFVDKGKASQGQHALDSLKNAMKWDEDTFGLEYDLDIYMVVAVDFFNMGAMENKGLNVFNSKYVLADASTATDDDFFNIEAIIGHEYFHNWTGNRVTCRDWFQLSLKEGLTVFRDQQFSADMFSQLATRISQVKVMREHQFAEDAGPMSHPIRPDEVMEMNNFYTVTVYDKGAEVIRMLHTLLKSDGFRRGMDLYFERHDGQAVTCDDFVNAMQDANEVDLAHFKKWYSQSGTPEIKVDKRPYQDGNKVGVELVFSQHTKPTADQDKKEPLYIPIKMECLSKNGERVTLPQQNDTFVLTEETQSLVLSNAADVPVLLSDFSAPVILHYDYSVDDLLAIIEHARNDYSRWDASQHLYFSLIKERYDAASNDEQSAESCNQQLVFAQLHRALSTTLSNHELSNELLSVPSVEAVMQKIDKVDPVKLDAVRNAFIQELSNNLYGFLGEVYTSTKSADDYQYEKGQVNRRRLNNVVLQLIGQSTKEKTRAADLIMQHYIDADNMTDKLGALKAAQGQHAVVFDELMQRFESEYGDNAVVMDKWFALHATTARKDSIARLTLLQSHKQFTIKNPNKVRSLIGSFAFFNTSGFHAKDGSGYKFLTDYLLELDGLNPQVASRLVTPLIQREQFSATHDDLMKAQLQRLMANKSLSKDLFEKVSKSLLR